MSTMTDEQYAAAKGARCPACRSLEMGYGSFNVDAGSATQVVVCLGCEAEWLDVYALTGYADLDVGGES